MLKLLSFEYIRFKMTYMIKTTIFTIVFSHGFVLLSYSPVTVIMAFTCVYDGSGFPFGIADFALLETNNVILILVFHIIPSDTITSTRRMRS